MSLMGAYRLFERLVTEPPAGEHCTGQGFKPYL
jgi:hypothetical protein